MNAPIMSCRLHNRLLIECAALLLGVTGGGCVVVSTAWGEPLLLRNANPLLAPYGFPAALPAKLPAADTGSFGVTLLWANSATVEGNASHALTLDGEAQELRLRGTYAFTDRFAMVAEVPWRHLSGGTLDSFIDDWHKTFGMPNGSRLRLPRDQLLIEYREGDAVLFHFDQDSSGIGDVPISLGYQMHTSDANALAGWLTVKAPTGDPAKLSGSGATDAAFSLSGQAQFGARWQGFGQADAVWLGKGDIVPDLQQSFAWSALAGMSWHAWRGLDLTAQINANSKVFDAAKTHFTGDAVLLNFGGSYRTAGGWRFDVGLGEDIETKASPDATFSFGLQHAF